MKVVCMRSLDSKVTVEEKVVGSIESGLLLLVGFTQNDTVEEIDYMIKKIINLRIFNDEDGIMNKSILDVKGEVLSISQFTLYADTKKGNRPSYAKALSSVEAVKLYDLFNQKLRKYVSVETGIFGADMKVDIKNDGPVTIILERSGSNDEK